MMQMDSCTSTSGERNISFSFGPQVDSVRSSVGGLGSAAELTVTEKAIEVCYGFGVSDAIGT